MDYGAERINDGRRPSMNRRRFAVVCAALGLSATRFSKAIEAAAQGNDTITPGIVAQAEKVAGLSLTDDERKRIAERINRFLSAYESLRGIDIENDVPPAIAFDPVLPGMTFPIERIPFEGGHFDATVPDSTADLAFLPVISLAALIKTRRVSSTELTKMYLERLKKYDPVLTCVVNLTEDLALRQAKRADEEIAAGKYRGILHGVPWGVKDIYSVKGFPTTWGAGCYRTRTIDTDATVVTRLTEAGAVLLGKLSTGRFASGARWFGGETKNPWNTNQSSSGSSAGPGAATAAGLVAFSLGSETRGSIAGPSERCGVSGLRPTFGRVSRHGVMTLSWSMDKVGPLCRSAEDCAVVLNAVYGPDGLDGSVADIPFNWNPSFDVSKLRVGYVEAEFDGSIDSPDDRAKKNRKFNNGVLDILRSLGVELVPIELPAFGADIAYIVLFTEAAAAFDYMNAGMTDLVDDSGESLKQYPAYRFVPAAEYIQVNRYRTLAMREMAKLMECVDAYVSPTFVGPTNFLTNMTGHPEAIVPCGFNEDGTPVSMSFVGRLYGEAELLALVKAYQNRTDFHTKHPKNFLK